MNDDPYDNLYQTPATRIVVTWTPSSPPTNPILTLDNIQSAGPCGDPECPICKPLRSVHPTRYPHH